MIHDSPTVHYEHILKRHCSFKYFLATSKTAFDIKETVINFVAYTEKHIGDKNKLKMVKLAKI